jgi:hypothetical protein
MRGHDQSITVQGALSLVAIAAMLAYAGYALQLGPHDSVAASTQEVTAQGSPATDVTTEDAAKAPISSAGQSQHSMYTGKVIRRGAEFVLQGAAGALYRLDDAAKALPFAGRSVMVTGNLDETAKLIHVKKIEAVRA